MTFATAHRAPGRAGMLGLSLIELMAALTIGLLLIAGALTVYMQSRNTYRTTDTAARMQETARYAFDIIEPDVRLAGFWGMKKGAAAVTDTVVGSTVGGNCGGDGWLGDATKYVGGVDSGWGGMTCTPPTTPVVWTQAANTDVLVVRRASAETSALDVNKVQVQSNRAQATVFASATAPGGYGAWPAAETRDMVCNVYYIATAPGNLVSLRRKALRGKTVVDEEVIPGVQDLQVQFGIDANGDGAAEKYVNPASVGTASIVAARIWLLVRAESDEQGFSNGINYQYANANIAAANDKRRRVLMSKTIQIRNAQS